jgi:YHS domain-containing protein
MKKLMTIMTACFVAGLACAQTVTSANIVGYKQITLQPGFNLIALNWQPVGYTGGVEQVAITNLFDPTEQAANLTAGIASSVTGIGVNHGDTIKTWDPIAGYQTYFFCTNKFVGTTPVWVGSDTHNPTTDTIPLGGGFWLFHQGVETNTITLSGQVKYLGVAHQHVIEPGFNMIGSGFASDAPLNDARWNWAGDGAVYGIASSVTGIGANHGDTIKTWDPIAGYQTYFFCTNKFVGTTPVWVGTDTHNPTTDSIPLGSAVWYYHEGVSAIVLHEAQPY